MIKTNIRTSSILFATLVGTALGACDHEEENGRRGVVAQERGNNGCPEACDTVPGDINGDGSVDISDQIAFVSYFNNGTPICELGADVNGDGSVDISDLIYWNTWMWNGGSDPVPPECIECAHDVNQSGVALDPECDDCVATVCAADPYCCNVKWDGICVNEAADMCTPPDPCEDAELADVNGDGSIDITDWTNLVGWMFNGSPSEICEDAADVNGDCQVDISDWIYYENWMFEGGPDPVACNECAHDICATGEALDPGCDECASDICDVDPYCCDVKWDSICVGEVVTVCGETCG